MSEVPLYRGNGGTQKEDPHCPCAPLPSNGRKQHHQCSGTRSVLPSQRRGRESLCSRSEPKVRCGTEAGSYLRRIDSYITQPTAQGPSRTCNESKEEEEEKVRAGAARGAFTHRGFAAHQASGHPHLPTSRMRQKNTARGSTRSSGMILLPTQQAGT